MINLSSDKSLTPDAWELADFFKVFSDERRLKILLALLDKSLCVSHICEAVGMEQSAVSHNLAILKRANLVKCARSEKKMVYSIADEHVFRILQTGLAHAECLTEALQ